MTMLEKYYKKQIIGFGRKIGKEKVDEVTKWMIFLEVDVLDRNLSNIKIEE